MTSDRVSFTGHGGRWLGMSRHVWTPTGEEVRCMGFILGFIPVPGVVRIGLPLRYTFPTILGTVSGPATSSSNCLVTNSNEQLVAQLLT